MTPPSLRVATRRREPTGGRAPAARPFRVPSAGMSPSLIPGDQLFVDRRAKSPAPGDVIVFTSPEDESRDYVMRVVALAGDRVQVRDNRLFVNESPVTGTLEVGDCANMPDHLDGCMRAMDSFASKRVPVVLGNRRPPLGSFPARMDVPRGLGSKVPRASLAAARSSCSTTIATTATTRGTGARSRWITSRERLSESSCPWRDCGSVGIG